MKGNENNKDSPIFDETQPHQINAPTFKGTGIEMKAPFVNRYGVVIGDSLYDSDDSLLNNWSDEVDPSIMSGDEWVHPTNDIGWNTDENHEMLHQKRAENGFLNHDTHDTGYLKD